MHHLSAIATKNGKCFGNCYIVVRIRNCFNYLYISRLSERTYSLWAYIKKHINQYVNPTYACNIHKVDSKRVLQPQLFAQSIMWVLFIINQRTKKNWRLSITDFGKTFISVSKVGYILGNHPKNYCNQWTITPIHWKITWNCLWRLIITSSKCAPTFVDFWKSLFQRVKSLGVLLSTNSGEEKSLDREEDNKQENQSSKENNETLIETSKDTEVDTLEAPQIEEEIKSVALDWKLSRSVNKCTCMVQFDVFNRKVIKIQILTHIPIAFLLLNENFWFQYHCYSCGNAFCVRCMGADSVLPGHSSQSPVPTCKNCSRKSSTSTPWI